MSKGTVLISGLGIAGPTLAYWLRRHGFAPTIVERAPAPRTGGYMIDFWGVGYDVADRMALVPELERDGYRMDALRLVDRRGRRIGGLDARVFEAASGGRFVSLPRGELARRIMQRLDGAVDVILDDSITGVVEDERGVVVSFEGTPERRFDLLAGADGLHSNVRRLVFAGAPAETYLGYYVAAFSVADYPHRDEGVYVSFALPGRQAARYALRGNRSAFLLVFRSDAPLDIALHDATAQRRLLRDAFGGAGWECDEILDAMERASDLYFDAVAQMRMPHWSRGRTVLVGDAAYCPSLLAGQGCAFGMAGAYVLAQALAAHPDDHRAAFDLYERDFKPFVDAKQAAAARFAYWFAPPTLLGLWMRTIATSVMNVPFIGPALARRSFSDRYVLPFEG